jgi:hypothetical protein
MKKNIMITPYKKLNKHNQELWNKMKKIYLSNPKKYIIKKNYIKLFTGKYLNYINLYEINKYKKIKKSVCDSIDLCSDEKFPGYKETINDIFYK